jgi:hypothetical protein
MGGAGSVCAPTFQELPLCGPGVCNGCAEDECYPAAEQLSRGNHQAGRGLSPFSSGAGDGKMMKHPTGYTPFGEMCAHIRFLESAAPRALSVDMRCRGTFDVPAPQDQRPGRSRRPSQPAPARGHGDRPRGAHGSALLRRVRQSACCGDADEMRCRRRRKKHSAFPSIMPSVGSYPCPSLTHVLLSPHWLCRAERLQ